MESTTHAYGWKKDSLDFRDYKFVPQTPVTDLPESVDLRPHMPPVFDQKNLGACTSHSVAAALWSAESIKNKSTDVAIPSRLFIYYNERVIENTVKVDSGASIRDSIKSVATYGACSEAEWPYDISKFAKKPSKKIYTAAKKEAIVQSYQSVDQSLQAMQSALAQGNPICIGIAVYSSFESETVARTGNVPMPTKKESLLGGHAVLLVGYSNKDQCFIFRNSWGEGWAGPMKGYGLLPYTYGLNQNLASDFWIILTV